MKQRSDQEEVNYWTKLGIVFQAGVDIKNAARLLRTIPKILPFKEEACWQLLEMISSLDNERTIAYAIEGEQTIDDIWCELANMSSNRVMGMLKDNYEQMFQKGFDLTFDNPLCALMTFDGLISLLINPLFIDINELDIDRVNLHMSRGIVLSQLGLLSQAIQASEQALSLHALPHLAQQPQLDDDRANLHVNLGTALCQQGQLPQAIQAYKQALALHTLPHLAQQHQLDVDRATLHMNFGSALYQQGQLPQAIEAYEQALALHALPHLARQLQLNADRAKLHMNRGVALGQLGQLPQALKAYEQALALHALPHLAQQPQLDVDRATLYMNYGAILAQQDQLLQAIQAYEQALALHALPHLAQQLHLDADRADLHINFGAAFYQQGQLPQAIEAHEQALALHALPHLAKQPQLDVKRIKLNMNLAVALYQQGQLPQAIEAYEQALTLHALPHLAQQPQLDVDRAYLNINRGTALYQQGQLPQALEAYEQAEQLYESPHIKYWQHIDYNRCTLYFNMTNLLPHMPDASTWARTRSDRMTSMLELTQFKLQDNANKLRDIFLKFHLSWLHYCEQQKIYDDIPRILAAIQGRQLAAQLFDEMDDDEFNSDRSVAIVAYQKRRMELRELSKEIRQLNKAREASDNPEQQKNIKRTLASCEKEYHRLHNTLFELREAAAKVPGYETLNLPYGQLLPDDLQATLQSHEILLLLIDMQDLDGNRKQGIFLLRATGKPHWISTTQLHEISSAMERYNASVNRRNESTTTHSKSLSKKELKHFWQTLSCDLQQQLWQPLAPYLNGIRRVICVTQGALHLLPLNVGKPASLDICCYPGLIFYALSRQLFTKARPLQSTTHPIGLIGYAGRENDIPCAEAEVNALAHYYQQHGIAAVYDCFTNDQVIQLLHIASHGNNTKDDTHVAIQLPDADLDMHTIRHSPVQLKYVALFACVAGQTADNITEGDPIGLVSGFFQKGV